MLTLEIDHRYVKVKKASTANIRKIEAVTSYLVSGYYFAPSFKNKRWDGREHLMEYSINNGYAFPAGLANDVIRMLKMEGIKHKVKWVSRKVPPMEHVFYPWSQKIKPRPYQLEAAEAVLKPGPEMGRGILKMPIRSGKTITAAWIIQELAVKAIILVPSQLLLYQTQKDISRALMSDNVGIIGDGTWQEGDVTVATVQTVAKAMGSAEYERLIRGYHMVFFDECHHLKGEVWHQVMMDFRCVHRIGLSATAYLDNQSENEKGVIWLKACCGDMRIDIPTTRLIEEGYLLRPDIRLYPIEEPNMVEKGWSAKLQNLAVNENEVRNEKIASLAAEHVEEGRTVLIISNRMNQIDAIVEKVKAEGLDYTVVTGSDSSKVRKERIKDFVDGEVDVLIGSVFYEGVDLPTIECVINAEGGRDVKATIQRMRNLTPNPEDGKKKAIFIDFLDMTNPYFAEHSMNRLRTYRSEPAFQVRVIRS